MKGNSLLVGLAFLLAALSVGVTLMAFQYVQLTRALNSSQYAIKKIEDRQNQIKALVAVSLEYSQRNPAINPILYTIGAKQPPAGSSAPTPTR